MFSRNTIAIDYEHVVAGRRLMARFQPQQWINDDAVSSSAPVLVDVTEAYLRLSPGARAALRDCLESSDDLVWTSSEVWQRHGGPGYVEVEDALEAFHAP